MKNDLMKKITLISKFMTSQPGLQIVERNILPDISQSKGSKTMKYGR